MEYTMERISHIPPFTASALTVALGSTVKGVKHSGAFVTSAGHWQLRSELLVRDFCGGNGLGGCRQVQQIRMLQYFMRAVADANYTGDITIFTANNRVERVLCRWLNGRDDGFPWTDVPLDRIRAAITDYSGTITVSGNPRRTLTKLAGRLSDIAQRGAYSTGKRADVEVAAKELVLASSAVSV
jgi:hypothetical protein